MSYDLFFKARDPSRKISTKEFQAYFHGQRFYNPEKEQTFYKNEATGVYFVFDLSGIEDAPENSALLPVAFNINFYRPHVFALEAEPELSAFVRHFDLLVFDPQNDGMGDGEYSREGFLRGWNHGNDFAYSAMLSPDRRPERILTMPASKIEESWDWNLFKDDLQSQYGEKVFVPRVFFIDFNGKIFTAVVWGDGIPVALPIVDYVIVPRQELAPTRFFKRQEDKVVLTWSELYHVLLADFRRMEHHGAYFLLDYVETPPRVRDFLKAQNTFLGELGIVSIDLVLDEEMVQKYTRGL